MNKGIIYLVQPTELIGSQRYKIGCSKNTELERVKKGYKKGTRYIYIIECYDPFTLEKNIKKIFNEKFKLIAGYEYFEGDETKIKEEFFNGISQYEKKKDTYIDEIVINEDSEIEDDNDYTHMVYAFENYKEDEDFGGNKKLIKFSINDFSVNAHYISDKCSTREYIGPIYDDGYNHIESEYLKKLIKHKIIENDKIYDLNNTSFLNKIKKYMLKINIYCSSNIENINNFFLNNTFTQKKNIINNFFLSNAIINKNIFCEASNYNNLNLVSNCYISIYSDNYKSFSKDLDVVKINKMYYDYDFLRHNVPYQLHIGKQYFYIENRDYKNFNLKKEDIISDKYKSIYLFNSGCVPWYDDGNSNLEKIINKYNKLTHNKKCLNLSKETEYLINIFNKL